MMPSRSTKGFPSRLPRLETCAGGGHYHPFRGAARAGLICHRALPWPRLMVGTNENDENLYGQASAAPPRGEARFNFVRRFFLSQDAW